MSTIILGTNAFYQISGRFNEIQLFTVWFYCTKQLALGHTAFDLKNQNSCLPTQTPLHWQTYVFPVPCFYRFTRNSPRACSALESGQRFGACVMSYRLGWSEFENCAIQSLGWSKKLETWLKLTLKFMLGGWPQKPARYLALGSCGKGQIL